MYSCVWMRKKVEFFFFFFEILGKKYMKYFEIHMKKRCVCFIYETGDF